MHPPRTVEEARGGAAPHTEEGEAGSPATRRLQPDAQTFSNPRQRRRPPSKMSKADQGPFCGTSWAYRREHPSLTHIISKVPPPHFPGSRIHPDLVPAKTEAVLCVVLRAHVEKSVPVSWPAKGRSATVAFLGLH